jgi:predicted MFS family arabinose efflux permease
MTRSRLYRTGFFRLWAAESVSMAGSQVTMFALPLAAVITLHASAWQVGLLAAAGSVAVLLLGLPAGVWADRYERRAVMLLANLVRGLALLAIPVLFWLNMLNLAVLMAVAFTVGAMTLLFDSAMSAYLPRLVGDTGIQRANSWFQATTSVGEVTGPGVAGALVQILGAPATMLADSVSYLISSVALVSLPRAAAHQDPAARQSHRAKIVAGLRLLWGNRLLRPLAIAAAHFNLFTSAFFALFVLYAVRVLHFSPLLLGVVTMAGGVAGLAGSAVVGRVSARFGVSGTLVACYALPGAAGLLVPAAGSFGKVAAVACVMTATFAWSFCVTILLVLDMSLRQQLVPDQYLGRISATIRFITWGLEPVGAVAAGALASSVFGIREVMTLAALGIIPSGLWPLLSEVRQLRTMPQLLPEPVEV